MSSGDFHKRLNDFAGGTNRLWLRCARNPALLFAVVGFFLSASHFILGPYSYVKWHDLGDGNFTRYAVMARSFLEHGISYWYPYAAAGVDLLSNGYRFTDVFFLAFVVFPDSMVIGFLRFAQYFIAGWFTYRLCRDSLGLDQPAAAAGGLFFSLTQVNLIEYYFGLGALPLVIWVLERLAQRPGRMTWVLAAVTGIAYSMAANVPLVLVFAIPVILVWLFFVRGLWKPSLVGIVSVFVVACLAFQTDMIWALVGNAGFSNRLGRLPAATSWWLGLATIKGFLWRSLPLAAIVLAAVLFAHRCPAMRSPVLTRIAMVVAVIVLFVIVEPPLRELAGTVIPMLVGFHMYRLAEFLPFFLSAGAAVVIDGLNRAGGVETTSVGGLRLFLAASVVGSFAFLGGSQASQLATDLTDWVRWGSYTANYRSPNVEKIAAELRAAKEPFRVATVHENGLQPAYANVYGLESVDGPLNMYPRRYQRYWSLVIEPFLERNPLLRSYFIDIGSRIALWTDDGHPLHLDVDRYFRISLLSLANVRYVLTNVPLISPTLELSPETRPNRYWDSLSRSEKIRARLRENFFGRHVMVYKNEMVLPRWFFAGVRFYDDQAGLDSLLRTATAPELAESAMVEEKYRAELQGIGRIVQGGAIDPAAYSPDYIKLEISAPERAMLVVSNTFTPYWRCLVDGRERRIVPVYGTFWGVSVTPRDRVVQFVYRPRYAFFSRRR